LRTSRSVAGVLQRDLVALLGDGLADRGQLDRDLGVPGETSSRKGLEGLEVRLHGGVGLVGVVGVLAEIVEADPEVLAGEFHGCPDGVLGLLARYVAAHDPGGDRHGADQALDPTAACERQQRLSERRHAGKATSCDPAR
jgi:hypothetical protein